MVSTARHSCYPEGRSAAVRLESALRSPRRVRPATRKDRSLRHQRRGRAIAHAPSRSAPSRSRAHAPSLTTTLVPRARNHLFRDTAFAVGSDPQSFRRPCLRCRREKQCCSVRMLTAAVVRHIVSLVTLGNWAGNSSLGLLGPRVTSVKDAPAAPAVVLPVGLRGSRSLRVPHLVRPHLRCDDLAGMPASVDGSTLAALGPARRIDTGRSLAVSLYASSCSTACRRRDRRFAARSCRIDTGPDQGGYNSSDSRLRRSWRVSPLHRSAATKRCSSSPRSSSPHSRTSA